MIVSSKLPMIDFHITEEAIKSTKQLTDTDWLTEETVSKAQLQPSFHVEEAATKSMKAFVGCLGLMTPD